VTNAPGNDTEAKKAPKTKFSKRLTRQAILEDLHGSKGHPLSAVLPSDHPAEEGTDFERLD